MIQQLHHTHLRRGIFKFQMSSSNGGKVMSHSLRLSQHFSRMDGREYYVFLMEKMEISSQGQKVQLTYLKSAEGPLKERRRCASWGWLKFLSSGKSPSIWGVTERSQFKPSNCLLIWENICHCFGLLESIHMAGTGCYGGHEWSHSSSLLISPSIFILRYYLGH